MTNRTIRRSRRLAVTVGAGAAFALASAAPALAGTPTGIYSDFDQCPTSVMPTSSTCFVSDNVGGTFKLGNQDVPITDTIRLQGGFSRGATPGLDNFYPAANGKTLIAPAMTVPGGLAGITVPSLVPQPIRGYLQAAINDNVLNKVTATPELVGPVEFSRLQFQAGAGRAITLPLRVKLNNAFLGDNCYLGSAGDPLKLNLTTGTTVPTGSYDPLVGVRPTLSFQDSAKYVLAADYTMVDNTFKAPKADGCGGFFFSWAIDPVVNLKIGLPSNPGVSYAQLDGDAQIASRQAVIDSE